MENILVSACLLGENCRYDGKAKPNENIKKLKNTYNLIPVCPEVLGGLETPRSPAEILGRKVINKDGADVTAYFENGAEKALETAIKNRCKIAVLKANSPSCGKGRVYDGSFSGKLIDGNGICASLLLKNGIMVFDENNIDTLLNL